MSRLSIQGEGVIASVTFRHDGKHIVGGSGLGTVRRWRTDNGKEVGRVMRVGVEVGAVATSKDGLWIVGGTTVGSAIVWDGKTHEKVMEIKDAHDDWVLVVDVSPDSKTFVTGSYDETAVVWEFKTGKKLFEPLKHPGHVGGAKFSPSGDRLATATWVDSSIRIFDSHSGDLLIRIPSAVSSVYINSLGWSDNGQRIFASFEIGIRGFNVTTASQISDWRIEDRYHVHVELIVLAHSGQFVVCTIDRTITIWDTTTCTKICQPIELDSRLRSVAMSRDDTRLALGQTDNRILLLNLPDILPHSYFVAQGTPTRVISENSRWNVNYPIRGITTPLMHVAALALESWMQGRLGNVESVFTQEIDHSPNSAHHALANRALVRVRSKRWRDAIGDAEKSIKIQPSAIAFIAKCLALVGDGQAGTGYLACDQAVAQFPRDAQFLRVIKSIICCITEENEETISQISDQIAKVDNEICGFIQAQLYFWLGNSQSSRGEHGRAVQSLKRAQLPAHPPENAYLTTISLLFGWNFEDLYINAQRGLCEALCKADQPKEAIETLHKMTGSFGVDVQPSWSTMEWVVDFSQRCVLALEQTGHAASSSYDYEKAVVHYALAMWNSQELSKHTLKGWTNAKLATNDSWGEVLRAAAEFTTSRFAIFEVVCDVLAECGRLSEATECFNTIVNDIDEQITTSDEYNQWALRFKHCCGDVAMQLRQYDAAIEHYSAAMSHEPLNLQSFIKRSRARSAKGLLEDALQDANKAIELDPSRPLVYETKHTVLLDAKRYDEAIKVFEDMLEMLEQSEDPEISQLRSNYFATSETINAVELIVGETQKRHPLVLIDVDRGHLCNASERMRIFKSDPVSKELISSMTRELDKKRIRKVVEEYLEYAMFSHVWTRPKEGKEPTFEDVENAKDVWQLPPSQTNEKLQNFCRTARNLGFRWAWSDTCCINKLITSILERSLTAMYSWYEHSAATVVLLATVKFPSKRGDLPYSFWMTRAWTLQELLAPKVIIFYDSAWKPYLGDSRANHKESPEIMQELAEAIGISSKTIVAFQPNDLTVREKLRLASTRNASEEEDIAYCLIGIFESDIKPHYGEGGYVALGHLLEKIVDRDGEVTVLDWIGKSSRYNSCLPDSLSVYSEPPYSPPELEEEEIGGLGHVIANVATSFYNQVNALPDAKFSNRRLSLPCIIFRATSLHIQGDHYRPEKEYAAEVPGLGQVKFTATGEFPLQEPRRLAFAHPWIHRLRDLHNEATPGPEAGVTPTPAPSSPTAPRVNEYIQALKLIARLQRPFAALLFQEQEKGKYKRVATERAIIVKPTITSLANIHVKTLQIQ